MRARDWIPVLVLAALCAAMFFVPSAATVVRDDGASMRAKVVSVDDSQVSLAGLVEYGTQHLEVEMLEGPAKGRRFPSSRIPGRQTSLLFPPQRAEARNAYIHGSG